MDNRLVLWVLLPAAVCNEGTLQALTYYDFPTVTEGEWGSMGKNKAAYQTGCVCGLRDAAVVC